MQDNPHEKSALVVEKPSKILLWAAIGMLLLGLAMLAFGVSFVADGSASNDWPVATGTVDTVRVTWDTIDRDSVNPDRQYYYQVYYSYEVDGQTYSGNRYSLGDGSTASQRWNSEEEAQAAAAAAYIPSQEIAVYYDPANPESAVLRPGASFSTYIPLIFAAFLVLGGLALGWQYMRQRG